MESRNLDFDVSRLVDVAEMAAYAAGNMAQEMSSQPRQIENKGFRDIVTDADLAAQSKITEIILNYFPDHGFLTEEKDTSLPTEGPIIWIVDPIDGTTNYSRQIPVFSVSVAAAIPLQPQTSGQMPRIGQVLSGAIYDPGRKELFSGGLGLGSRLKLHSGGIERPISVSACTDLESAMVGLDWGRSNIKRSSMLSDLGQFIHEVNSVRVMGSAALALAWVAAGRLDIYYNTGIGPWDVAAAKAILNEAGGLVSNPDGSTWNLGDKGCIASNGQLHDAFLKILPAKA
jgi:myo-inositol-1(or 4)-monophosphatase